jgi:integrator complex subunit 10
MAPLEEDVSMMSDEEYLVHRAQEELKRDPFSARAWMLTAKSLFPNNFNVQVIHNNTVCI